MEVGTSPTLSATLIQGPSSFNLVSKGRVNVDSTLVEDIRVMLESHPETTHNIPLWTLVFAPRVDLLEKWFTHHEHNPR